MPVSESYRAHVLERLEEVVPGIRAKRTLGSVGVYSRELLFALIADDVLYFKADESNRLDYERRGMRRFGSTPYYALPIDVLADPVELARWSEKALDAAARAPEEADIW